MHSKVIDYTKQTSVRFSLKREGKSNRAKQGKFNFNLHSLSLLNKHVLPLKLKIKFLKGDR